MYLAQFESSNFLFEGVGNTEQQARAILKLTLQRHCKQTGAQLYEFFDHEEVRVRQILPGLGFVDGQEYIREKVCAS